MARRSWSIRGRPNRWAIGRYTAGWVLAAAAVVVAVALLFRGGGPEPEPVEDAQRARLVVAAERAGCVLRTDAGGAPATRVDVSRPPTFGPSSEAAPGGVYTSRLPTGEIIGALRRGAIVVQYRGTLDPRARAALRLALSGAPQVIVVPDGSGMPYQVAATAWRRVLGCPSVNARALTALQAFRDRYLGVLGPEVPR